MDWLGHGAFTFQLVNTGNSYVDRNELAKAVDNREMRTIVKALQGFTIPNPVAFLTAGRQHSVELVSGHYLQIQGAGGIELADHFGTLTKIGLATSLAKARFAYGQEVNYEEP
jgi:hypothetical protein